jgi:hypothetical protein
MHDGASVAFTDAMARHRGEAAHVTAEFEKLTPAEKKALLTFSAVALMVDGWQAPTSSLAGELACDRHTEGIA